MSEISFREALELVNKHTDNSKVNCDVCKFGTPRGVCLIPVDCFSGNIDEAVKLLERIKKEDDE